MDERKHLTATKDTRNEACYRCLLLLMCRHGWLVLLAVFTDTLLSLALLIPPTSAAAQTLMPQFKNIDEMIGWVKAKGDCKETKGSRGKECKIRIDLPNNESLERKGKAVWQVWAWLELTDFYPEPTRYFRVTIIKSRNVALDSHSTIRSVKSSRYAFGNDGKVSEVSIGTTLELPNGEYLLYQEIILAPEFTHKHGEGASDSIILQSQLGVAWDYLRFR